ncbi:hypothetical protein [Variovorax paradoxus]|uniref:hypothetical protein n=1 Tax=Variovorax paradoxus TaxID=34073 RepID=UPI001ABC9431
MNAGAQAQSFRLPPGAWHGVLASDPAIDPGLEPSAVNVAEVAIPPSSLWIART